MINNWFEPKVWRNWWKPPKKGWWISPSGTKPPWQWYHYIMETPFSHLLGSTILFWLSLPLLGSWGAFWIVVVTTFYGQLQKADALFPNSYNIRNIVYRTIIGTTGGLFWALVI